jgi:hypothetical protein
MTSLTKGCALQALAHFDEFWLPEQCMQNTLVSKPSIVDVSIFSDENAKYPDFDADFPK